MRRRGADANILLYMGGSVVGEGGGGSKCVISCTTGFFGGNSRSPNGSFLYRTLSYPPSRAEISLATHEIEL